MRPGDVGRAGWLGQAVRLPVHLLWGLFLIGATDAAHAQEALMLPRLQSTIQFDGLSDEPHWEHVAPLPLTMYQPTFQGSPTERTEVRLVYDATYLYAAIRCYDTEPTSIRANSLYRDRLGGDDTFTLILDTFNDDENALSFSVNPAGARLDAAIFNDAEGFNPINIDWNTFWDVATVQNEQGWFAEVRIPFSSLRFQNAEGHVTMGLIAYRYIARKNELKSGTWIFFVPTLQFEDVRSPFALSDEAEIPVGRYTFVDVWAGYIMSSAPLFRLRLDGRFGSFYDGWLMRSMMRLTWNMSPFWELQGEYLPSIGRFPDRDQRFTAHLARLRIQRALNTRFSIKAFLQYSSSAKRISINARLRYHFREGNDLWLVYSEGLNTERQTHAFGLPLLPLSESRTVLLKYIYTFRL